MLIHLLWSAEKTWAIFSLWKTKWAHWTFIAYINKHLVKAMCCSPNFLKGSRCHCSWWLIASSSKDDTMTAVIKMFPVIGITRQNQSTKRILSASRSNILEYLVISNTDSNCLLSQDGIVKVNIVIFLTL